TMERISPEISKSSGRRSREGCGIDPGETIVKIRIHSRNQIRPADVPAVAAARNIHNRRRDGCSIHKDRVCHDGDVALVAVNHIRTGDQYFDRQSGPGVHYSTELPSSEK